MALPVSDKHPHSSGDQKPTPGKPRRLSHCRLPGTGIQKHGEPLMHPLLLGGTARAWCMHEESDSAGRRGEPTAGRRYVVRFMGIKDAPIIDRAAPVQALCAAASGADLGIGDGCPGQHKIQPGQRELSDAEAHSHMGNYLILPYCTVSTVLYCTPLRQR